MSGRALAERAALDRAVIAWTQEADWRADAERFGTLALELFAFQFEQCLPYRRFCRGRGLTPQAVHSWRRIPPVPTGAFKEVTLTGFPPGDAVRTFRTSGTSTASRGELHLDTLEVYEASLRPAFQRHVLPDLADGRRAHFLVLAPSPDESPDSSLSHMFGALLRDLGDPESRYLIQDGELDVGAAMRSLATLVERRDSVPIALCGTAFAFVHLLEALDAREQSFRLPESVRIMETGGFKGRSGALSRDELYRWIEARLGVAASRIVNQYGMTELGSQFYDRVLLDPVSARSKAAPPWTRVRVLDVVTGDDVEDGATGRINVYDLANTGSVLAIQTADLGRAVGDGFEVLGREVGAEERGCSIAVDELLAEARA